MVLVSDSEWMTGKPSVTLSLTFPHTFGADGRRQLFPSARRPLHWIEARVIPIPWWCLCEQMFLPRSVLEDFHPEAAVLSKKAKLQPAGHAARIVVDWARKAKLPGILIAVPFH